MNKKIKGYGSGKGCNICGGISGKSSLKIHGGIKKSSSVKTKGAIK